MEFASPKDLGFDPALYKDFRPWQHQTIRKILESNKKLVVLAAPTGSGKSVIALSVARALAQQYKTTTILTNQIALQEQYMGYEFKSGSTPWLAKGKRHFTCALEGYEDTKVDHAPCVSGFVCPLSVGDTPYEIQCEYYRQKALATVAKIRVLNYPFFMTDTAAFKSDLIICDEGHNVDNEILNVAGTELSPYLMNLLTKRFRRHWPALEHTLLSYNPKLMSEAKTSLDVVQSYILRNRERLEKAVVDLFLALRAIVALEGRMVVVSYDRESLKFSPVLPTEFAGPLLLDHAPKIVLMSATIFGADYWAHRLGVAPENTDYIEVPSSFPPERRPVYIQAVAASNYKDLTTDEGFKRLDKITKATDKIVTQHLPAKGLVHMTSYLRSDYYMQNSILAGTGILMLGKSNESIEIFKQADIGVLVSPRVREGLDLPEDMCRYVIFPKIPYPDISNPVVKVQREIDPESYAYQTVSAIIQGAGRGMRSAEDFCKVYILDSSWYGLQHQTKHLWPKWFLEAIIYAK